MSQVLEWVRQQDPNFKEVPDEELTRYIGDRAPAFFQDAEFARQYNSYLKPESLEPIYADQPLPANRDNSTPGDRAGAAFIDQERQNLEAGIRRDAARKQPSPGVAPLADTTPLDIIGSVVGQTLHRAGQVVGPAMYRSGKVTQAAFGDVLSNALSYYRVPGDVAGAEIPAEGSPVENLRAFAENPDEPLPVQTAVREAGGAAGLAGQVALSTVGAVPYLGAAAGLAMAGLPPAAAAALVMGFTPEGDIDPVGLAAALGLPIVDKMGRRLVGDVLAKKLQSTEIVRRRLAENPGQYSIEVVKRFPTLEKKSVIKALEVGGGLLADNLFLLGLQTPGVLSSDDPAKALTESVIANLGISLLGAKEINAAGSSATRRALLAKVARGEFPIQMETHESRRGEPTPRKELPPAESTPSVASVAPVAAPPMPASPPPEPALPPVLANGWTAAERSRFLAKPEDPSVILGAPTIVKGANNQNIEGVYAWVPDARLQASHTGVDFHANPAYPLKNTRDYAGSQAEQIKVLEGQRNFDPYEYLTNSRSASLGPVIATAYDPDNFAVQGGNGRRQIIERLTPEQRATFDQAADEEAEIYGLPRRPAGGYLLARLLPVSDFSTPAGLESANRTVDLLNPSPGLVENTTAMAANDARKVDIAALEKIRTDDTSANMRQWVEGLIANGTLDRNTRTQILANTDQVTNYVQRLLITAAYQNGALTEYRQDPKTSETIRGLIDSGVPLATQLRAKGETSLARAFAEMVNRVASYQAAVPTQKISGVLEQVYRQGEFESEEGKLARNIALALSGQVEMLPPNKRGERKVDYEETIRNFRDFMDGLSRSVKSVEKGTDLLGETRTVAQAIRDYVRAKVGDNLVIQEDAPGYGRVKVAPDPRVVRLNKLTREKATRKLTHAEAVEMDQIEAALGQRFMGFYNEQQVQQEQADIEWQRRDMLAKQKQRLVAPDLKTQSDMFRSTPEETGGQLAMFDKPPSGSNVSDTGAINEKSHYKDPRQVEFEFLQAVAAIKPSRLGGENDAGRPGVHGNPSVQIDVYAKAVRRALMGDGLDIVGRKVENLQQAALLFQPFRNTSFEVFRYALTKDMDIVGVVSITAKRPGQTYLDNLDHSAWRNLCDMVRATGANGYGLVHNHPSGDPTPSDPDLKTNAHLIRVLARGEHPFADYVKGVPLGGFWGHVILEGNTYSYIDAQGQTHRGQVYDHPTSDLLLTPVPGQKHGKHLNREIDREQMEKSVANIGKEIFAGEDHVSLLFISSRLKVRALADVPLSMDMNKAMQQLRRHALTLGAHHVLAYYKGSRTGDAWNVGTKLVQAGVLHDLIIDEGNDVLRSVYNQTRYTPQMNWDNYWMGLKHGLRGAMMIAENPPFTSTPALTAQFADVPGKPGSTPVQMGGMDHVRPVEMPELVKMAKQLTGAIPGLKRFPSALGAFYHTAAGEVSIKLNPAAFANPEDAAKVLAHELGQLDEYLPDKTMNRGNILGRIATLRNFLVTTLPLKGPLDFTKCLTPRDRVRIRRKAEQKVGPRPPKDEEGDLAAWQSEVSHQYGEMITEELAARGLVTREEVQAELSALSQFWHPYDPATASPGFVKYRESSKELYADALSVMLNSPGLLEEQAPLFYKMFWEYLDRKPEVKQTLFDLQDFLSRGRIPVIEQRRADTEAMFVKGEEIMRRKAAERDLRRRSWKGYWLELKQAVFDHRASAVDKVKELELRTGETVAPAKDPRNFFQEEDMTENANALLVGRIFEKVVQPVEASGISLPELGEYMLLQRIRHERSAMANPLGLDAKAARYQLLKMRLDLGLPKMTILEEAARRFHDEIFRVVEQAVQVGSYNRETFETTIVPNKYFYATFAVLDYLEDYIPAGIKQQIGTLKEVANPFTATLLKTIALNNLNAVQRSKRSLISLLQEHFPGEIKPAETYWTGKHHEPKKHPDHGILTVLENGAPTFHYVDPLIAQAFERLTPSGLEKILRPLDWTFRKLFYPMWITFNSAFQVANVKRDFSRTRRNLGALRGITGPGGPALAEGYAAVMAAGIRRLRGSKDPLVQEMVANFAVGLPEKAASYGLIDRDDYLHNLLTRYKLLPETNPPGVAGRTVAKILGPLRFAGNLIESLPKLSAYRILRREMGPREAAAIVRNYVGTPNVRTRGRNVVLIRPLVPFWNVFVQGYRADAALATNPKTASGWWFRWAAFDGMATMFMGLAGAGLLGAALKKLYDGFSEYDKTNYTVIPLGYSMGGDFGSRTVGMRVPRDEPSRLLSGLLYKAIGLAAGNPQGFSQAFAFGAGQFPTLNPAIDIPWNWQQYLSGQNPVDSFRGRPIIPDDAFSAGGWDSLKPMLIWTYNQSGLQDIVRFDPYKQSTAQVTLNMIPAAHRFIKITDQGYREQQRAVERADQSAQAQHRLSLPDNVRGLLAEYSMLRNINEQNKTPDQMERYQLLRIWYNQIYTPIHETWRIQREAGAKTSNNNATLDAASKPFEKAR